MCLSIELEGTFAYLGNNIIAGAKLFTERDKKLASAFMPYTYKFVGEFVEPCDTTQVTLVNFNLPDGTRHVISHHRNMGYHVSPLTEWRLYELATHVVWAVVHFRVEDIQMVGGRDVVVKTFGITPISVIKEVGIDITPGYKGLVKQQEYVLGLARNCGFTSV